MILFKTFQSRNIHDVFHVSLFESYINKFDINSKSFVFEIKEKKQWKIESIFDNRIPRKKKEFLIKWLNYFEFENQWTEKVDLKNCKELLIVYDENRQIKKNNLYVDTKTKKIDKKMKFDKKSTMTRFCILFRVFS